MVKVSSSGAGVERERSSRKPGRAEGLGEGLGAWLERASSWETELSAAGRRLAPYTPAGIRVNPA